MINETLFSSFSDEILNFCDGDQTLAKPGEVKRDRRLCNKLKWSLDWDYNVILSLQVFLRPACV